MLYILFIIKISAFEMLKGVRSFDPLFKNFENEICIYQWENQNTIDENDVVHVKPFS